MTKPMHTTHSTRPICCGDSMAKFRQEGRFLCISCGGFAANALALSASPDPLDRIYDGVTLRELLAQDEAWRREASSVALRLTSAQRAAVSAHWSAELRARVEAKAERDCRRVTLCMEDD